MGDGYSGQGWGGGMGWGGWLMMSLIALVCLALLGALIYWLVQGARGGAATQISQPPTRPRAQSTLADRFARGDIDEDEYLRRKALLDAQ
ncbi:MAG: SHOCT domain-containing protein [Ornithinibacter sp.]